MQELSTKEIEELNATVRRLRESKDIKDQIQGLLMDMNVGYFGINEPIAKSKAEALEKLFYTWLDDVMK